MPPLSTSQSASRLQLAAAFAVIYLVWGSTYLAIRFAVETIPPFLMAGARFLLAGAILYPLTRWSSGHRPTLGEWRSAWVIGSLLMLGGTGLVTWAEQWIDSAVAALIIATTPVWFVVVDWTLYRGARPGRWVVISTLLGLSGVWLLADQADEADRPISGLAVPALLAAPLLWAIGSVTSKRRPQPTPLLVATAMQMLCGGVMLAATGLAVGEASELHLEAISFRSAGAFVYLTVIGSLVAFTTYVWLVQNASPAAVSTYAYVNPLMAIVLAATIGDERIDENILAATVLVLLAVLTLTRHGRKTRTAGGALSADIDLGPDPSPPPDRPAPKTTSPAAQDAPSR